VAARAHRSAGDSGREGRDRLPAHEAKLEVGSRPAGRGRCVARRGRRSEALHAPAARASPRARADHRLDRPERRRCLRHLGRDAAKDPGRRARAALPPELPRPLPPHAPERGIEEYLLGRGYFYLVASHHFREELVEEYAHRFIERAADGLVVVNGPWTLRVPVPVATVSCRGPVNGAVGVQLDHRRAAELGLGHLVDLGHRRRLPAGRSPRARREVRWSAIGRRSGSGSPSPLGSWPASATRGPRRRSAATTP